MPGLWYNRQRPGANTNPVPKGYAGQKTGTKRHQYVAVHNSTALAAGAYATVDLLRFYRTDDPGAGTGTDDVEANPTTVSAYQDAKVFNGALARNFHTKIYIRNTSSNPISLDVYELALSFTDAYVFSQLAGGSCPVEFDSATTSSPGDNRGAVIFKAAHITLARNTVVGRKFTQRFMKLKNRITVPADGFVTLNVQGIPPKCRRSQTGMFWGLVFHNSSVITDSVSGTVKITGEHSFEEVPGNYLPPYLE